MRQILKSCLFNLMDGCSKYDVSFDELVKELKIERGEKKISKLKKFFNKIGIKFLIR